MQRLQGRSAIVTGGGAGIGQATSERLAAEGAAVLIADIDGAAAEAVASTINNSGGLASSISVDVADESQLQLMVKECVMRYGKVDILVNNAGVAVPGSVISLTVESWNTVIDINLRSMWLAMKFAIPEMPANGGSIINMSSVQALMGFPGWLGYAATKGAAIAMTQQAAVEYARKGIRVNAVAPGTIMTPMNQRIFDEAPNVDALKRAWGKQHALGRFGEASEVASVIAFLASDDASFVTGICIPVDGGMQILGPVVEPGD